MCTRLAYRAVGALRRTGDSVTALLSVSGSARGRKLRPRAIADSARVNRDGGPGESSLLCAAHFDTWEEQAVMTASGTR
jgi:hypothetical protein